MSRVLVGITGSVAAIRAPELVASLGAAGHEIKLVLTESARYFVDLMNVSQMAAVVAVHQDADEWPVGGYTRGDRVLHIDLRSWADILVVAPLDAHTLAKFALGLSDNLLSCVFRAWDFDRPVVLAPAMNTRMWESPVTRRHLAQLLEDRSLSAAPACWTLAEVAETFACHAPSLVLVPPQSKKLACGDVGMGAMAEIDSITNAVWNWTQPLEDSAEPA